MCPSPSNWHTLSTVVRVTPPSFTFERLSSKMLSTSIADLLVVVLLSLNLGAQMVSCKTVSTSGQMFEHKQSDGRCDLKKADRCTQTLYVYGDPSYRMSDTVEEAESFCNATREAELCLRNYANHCVKPFTRQYINLLMAGPTQVLRKRCSSSGITRYLEHKSCINATKTPIDVCTENAILDTMRILKAKKQDWISLSCCFISKSTQCSTTALADESKCDDKSRAYMKEAIIGFSSEVFDLFCGSDLQWDSHNCRKVTKNLPRESRAKKPLSVLPVVLEMMERF